MAKKIAPLLPKSEAYLSQFGERLRLARLRRRLSAKQVAERAGMAPMTLRSLERGSAGVTIGAYVAVMQVLGVEEDLERLVEQDALGRSLQDANLPKRLKASETGQKKPTQRLPADGPRPRRSSEDAKSRRNVEDWVEAGGFASAKELADLLAPASPPPKRRR